MRNLIPTLAACFPLLCMGANGPDTSDASPKRPNILFIICDDLNQALGCYGNDQVSSPNIDALAGRGMRFASAYAQWPSCLPSRFSFLSGWSPVTTEVIDFSFHSRQGPLADAVYLPGYFKDNGYYAARLDKVFHIGKDDAPSWNLSEEPHRDGTGAFKAIWTGIEVQALGLENRVLEEGRFNQVRGETGYYQVMDDSVRDEDLFDGRTAARAVELLEQFAADRQQQPFFLAVGFRRPHLPWVAPKRYFDLYPPASIQLPPRQPGLEQLFTAGVHRRMLAHYYAAVTFADTQVGKVVDALDRLDLNGNTVVVLIGDQGYCLGERDNFFSKGNLWERSLQVPLIIVAPGVTKPGASSDDPVELLDLYPTLVELAGLPQPGIRLEGSSLKPLLAGAGTVWRGHAVSFNYNETLQGLDRTIRTGRYRYTESADGTPAELVDYRSDPYEWVNLVGDSGSADVMQELQTTLRQRIALIRQ